MMLATDSYRIQTSPWLQAPTASAAANASGNQEKGRNFAYPVGLQRTIAYRSLSPCLQPTIRSRYRGHPQAGPTARGKSHHHIPQA